MDKKKILIIAAVVVIVVLNILWTVLQNKFTPKLAEVNDLIAKVEARVTKLEQGGLPDVADLREEFSKLKEMAAGYEERLAQLRKAEEDQLATLQAQVEAQKSRVESLKGQTMAPEAQEAPKN
ncbi:MAG: hypothetical protein IJR68_02215 [Fretibacterium sp.]|jgi:phage shock protein A|nr:hypothetical protein [Fretibacterium sp.]